MYLFSPFGLDCFLTLQFILLTLFLFLSGSDHPSHPIYTSCVVPQQILNFELYWAARYQMVHGLFLCPTNRTNSFC